MQTSIDLSQYAPEFALYLEKQSSPNIAVRKSAASVQINEQVGDSAQFTLALSDKMDVVKQQFVWLDNSMFDIGNTIRIDMGYSEKLDKIIEGPIKSLSTSGFSSEIPKLTLVGYDIAHSLLTEKSMSEKAIKPGNKDTYSEIVEKIADELKLEREVDKTKEYSPTITKKPVTYIDFLKDVAKRVGYDFFISRGKLFFIDPREKRGASMSFQWGSDLIQFTPTINSADLVTGVEVRGHGPDSKKKIVGVANSGDEIVHEPGMTASQLAKKINKKENVRTVENKTFSSKEEADDMAKAELDRIGRNLVTGSGSIVGNTKLMPGMTIELKNLGKRFSGRYFVSGVTHTIDGNGYTTSFNVRRNVIGQV